MYETHYPTDWDRLALPEAIERAYALGVTAACDRFDRAGFRRLLAELDDHDREVARVVFCEGRREARTRLSAGDSPEDVWAALVDRHDQPVGVADGGRDEGSPEPGDRLEIQGIPGALTRAGPSERGARQAVPGFLRGR